MPSKKINVKDRLEDNKIDLSMSDLDEVPVRDIIQLKKATNLDLSNNRIAVLGKNFPTLTHLVKLDLSKNQLTELPQNFGDLILLKYLDLYSNKLTHLPITFCNLRNLKWLDLKNNPLLPVFAKPAGDCVDEAECKKCATNMVKFMQVLSRQLEEEKKLEALPKSQAPKSIEQSPNKAKKEKKKKKKNGKTPSIEKTSEIKEDKIESLNDKIETEKSDAKQSIGTFNYTFYIFILLSHFLIVTFSLIFFFLQYDGSNKYINSVSKSIEEQYPSMYNSIISYREILKDWLKQSPIYEGLTNYLNRTMAVIVNKLS